MRAPKTIQRAASPSWCRSLPAAAPTCWRAPMREILQKKYGKTFIIENRPGGGTTLAATATSNAKPDGYTLMQGTSGTMAMNPTIFKHINYEPLKTLVPVSLVAGVPFVLTVNPDIAGAQRGGPGGARQEEGRRGQAADLRFRRRRRVPSSLRRAVQQPDRHQDDPCPLPGQRPGHPGADLRPDRRSVRRPRADVAADQGRQGPRRSASPAIRCSRRRRTSSRLPRLACRLGRTALPGRCCSRPAARRSRSSKS